MQRWAVHWARRTAAVAGGAALVVSLFAAGACAPDPERFRAQRTIDAEYDTETGRLELITFDSNDNGTVDTWSYMDGNTVRMTKRWMSLADVHVSFCNEQSVGVFKKCGWTESFDPNVHYFPLRPFDHRRFATYIPTFLRSILNVLPSRYFRDVFRKQSDQQDELTLEPATPGCIDRFEASYHPQPDSIQTLRDIEYFSWRFLGSPERDRYRLAGVKGIEDRFAMIKLFEARGLRYIDVLCLSDSERLDDVRRILSKLALWGIDNQYSYIRLLTFHRRLSDFLRINLKTVARPHRFTYFSTEPQILEQLRKLHCNFELIDSDWEQFS